MNRSAFASKIFAVAVVLLLAITANGWAGDRVLLVSWDGVRRDTLDELLYWQAIDETPRECPAPKHGPVMPVPCNGYLTCLPGICQFQIIDMNVVEGKPLTRPQHAQILSGYGPQETGDITQSGRHGLPQGYSLYERIKPSRPEIVTAQVAGAKYVSRGITRYAKRNGMLNLDGRRGGPDHYTGERTTVKVLNSLAQIGSSPYFAFGHFKAADILGHKVGSGSAQYREGIIQNDIQLRALLDFIDSHDMYEQVYVVTDHGFDRNLHVSPLLSDITQTWFASRSHNLETSFSATPLDVVPTILDTLCIPFTQENPPYRGKSLLIDSGDPQRCP